MSALLEPNVSRDATTKVAIVEDKPGLRQYLAELIGGTPGYRCVCACASAEEALVKIPNARPNVVLMDIQLVKIPNARPNVVLMDIHLPGESGIACTAQLRQKLPKLQVIMLTVYKDIKVITQALKAGACGYVLKRADEKEILDAIAEVRAGGAPMTSEVARMVVRTFMEAPKLPDPNGTEQLSARESELLALVAEGFTNKEIGARLNISNDTVRSHLVHIFEKLHVRCRTEAAAKYFRSKPESVALPPRIQ
jgi:DNA-binding NarL/FixJ family response regulator